MGRAVVAADPDHAAVRDKERAIKEALLEKDLKWARKLVNGGSHGIERFTETFSTGEVLLP